MFQPGQPIEVRFCAKGGVVVWRRGVVVTDYGNGMLRYMGPSPTGEKTCAHVHRSSVRAVRGRMHEELNGVRQ